MAKILLVEDDEALMALVKEHLEREHYVIEFALRGDDALDLLAVSEYDLTILDWTLPGVSGIEICKWLRAHHKPTVVLMLTANDSQEEKELGLDCGADDYLTKPFGTKELLARVRALLRRPAFVLSSDSLTHGAYQLRPAEFLLEKSGQKISLQPQEFALLEFLFRHPKEVFSIDALLSRVWKAEVEATEDSLRGCVKRIRKKLDDPTLIQNVHGVGYKLQPSD